MNALELITATVEPSNDTGDVADRFWKILQAKLKIKHVEYGMFDNHVGRWVHDGSEPAPVGLRGANPMDLRRGTQHEVSIVVIGGQLESVHYKARGFRIRPIEENHRVSSVQQAVAWVVQQVKLAPVTATVEPSADSPTDLLRRAGFQVNSSRTPVSVHHYGYLRAVASYADSIFEAGSLEVKVSVYRMKDTQGMDWGIGVAYGPTSGQRSGDNTGHCDTMARLMTATDVLPALRNLKKLQGPGRRSTHELQRDLGRALL